MDEMTNNTSVETTEAVETEETKTYTQEEVMQLLQSEADKRVTAALKKQQAKYEKQLSLSKLDGNEREKAEKDNRIAELEEQIAAFQVERNKSELKSVLQERSLDVRFADIITITDDLEESQRRIDLFDKIFKACVRAEVEKRLAGNTPKGNGNAPAEITKESVKNMSLAELQKLKKTNPELYNNLFN